MPARRFRLVLVALTFALLGLTPVLGSGLGSGIASADSARVSAEGTLVAQRTRPRAKKKRGKAATEPAASEPSADGKNGKDSKDGADSAGAVGADGAVGKDSQALKPDPAAKPPEPAPDGKAGKVEAAAPSTAPASPGGPAPTTTESTTPEVASSAELVDVDTLRQEYLKLRDELFTSRARASTISSQLYSTRVSIRFAFGSGRHYGVNKATVRLDGATVYEDTDGAVAADDAVRFEGYVAPGRHTLTFRIEVTGKDDDRFTSANEAQVTLQAVAGKDLVVTAKAKDGGDIAYQWKRGEKGSYGLGMDISVKAQKRAAPKTASARAAGASVAAATGARP